MQPAVFLDRDNTIIHDKGHLGDPAGAVLLPDVPTALLELQEAGYLLVVVTNQSGVARGFFTEDDVHAVHDTIRKQVQDALGGQDLLKHWYYSPWHPEGTVEAFRGEHHTRKPEPGMLMQAAEELEIDLARSWMLGDQDRDIRAGQRAGCRAILLTLSGINAIDDPQPDAIVDTFRAAADVILGAT